MGKERTQFTENVREGIALVFSQPRQYTVVFEPQDDFALIARSFADVGNDLRTAIRQHAERTQLPE